MARPKDIGTRAETAVVNFLRVHGFPQAERRALHGTTDLGDITGIPGICIEVKAGEQAHREPPGLLTAWMNETKIETVNANADLGVLVLRRKNRNVRDWWAVLTVTDLLTAHGLPDLDVLVDLGVPNLDRVGNWKRYVRLTLADAAAILRTGWGDLNPYIKAT